MNEVDPLGGLGPESAGAPTPAAPAPMQRRKPPPTPTAYALVAILGAFFVVQCVMGGNDTQDPLTIFRLGGLNWVAVLDGDVYRLGSYSFLHFGVAHILLNGWALFILMRMVESAFGSVTSLGLYAMSVLAGGIASAISVRYGHNPYVLAAGASGGIAGLFGAYIALWMRVRKRIPQEAARATMKMLVLNLGLNVVIAWFASASGFSLDNWAHLGGLGAGFIFGLLAPLGILPRHFWSRPAQALLVLATFVLASMEGAAVARAVNPHPRELHASGLVAETPWMLVPIPARIGVENDPGTGDAVSPGGIGLRARIVRSSAPLTIPPGSEALPIGDRTWLRVREKGEREGEEIQQLFAKDGAGTVIINLLCESDICRGAMADDAAIEIARTLHDK